ncbi:MAG: O-antigen ligase family protein [Acidobacteriota bacterium]
MSIRLGLKPYNAFGYRTYPNFRTAPWLLFALACAATLTIAAVDPAAEAGLADWVFECAIFLLAAWLLIKHPSKPPWTFLTAIAALSLWGIAQLAFNASSYSYATLQAALRFAAFGAAALSAYLCLRGGLVREQFLEATAWFGFVISIVGVLAYHTSPNQVLWLFPSPYPDTWGPFLSRNNFAQFLELILPIALWLAFSRREVLHWSMAATILAAGLVSASRAGATILLLETLVGFLVARPRGLRTPALFATAVVGLGVLAGADTLVRRFALFNPLADRVPIYSSTLAMISQRPAQGFGLGTFASVYPEFANFDSGYRIDHAHSDWLEWTAEGGLGFALVWLVLAIAVTPRAIKTIWGLGIPAVFLHALVDFPLARIGIAVWVFILVGAIERTSEAAPPSHRRTP